MQKEFEKLRPDDFEESGSTVIKSASGSDLLELVMLGSK
jgi:hypothetical protein